MNRRLAGRSILEPMLNLRCSAGHRWYSPTPTSFAGELCRLPGDQYGKHGCQARTVMDLKKRAA